MVTDKPLRRFTLEELTTACKILPFGKIPGPDGIHDEIIRMFARRDPGALLDDFNSCLRDGVFPEEWDTTQLMLIHKGGGMPVTVANSYRRLCMLNNIAKLLEKLLLARLNLVVLTNGDLTGNQLEFRTRWSTVQAIQAVIDLVGIAAVSAVRDRDVCIVVTLNIRNAFNLAP